MLFQVHLLLNHQRRRLKQLRRTCLLPIEISDNDDSSAQPFESDVWLKAIYGNFIRWKVK